MAGSKRTYMGEDPVQREKDERASRKRLRTEWRTGASEKEKKASLSVALNQLGGNKKYSWLQSEVSLVFHARLRAFFIRICVVGSLCNDELVCPLSIHLVHPSILSHHDA